MCKKIKRLFAQQGCTRIRRSSLGSEFLIFLKLILLYVNLRPTKGHLTFTSLLRKFMLWLFFLIPGNYVFLLFWGMVMYANELETKEK